MRQDKTRQDERGDRRGYERRENSGDRMVGGEAREREREESREREKRAGGELVYNDFCELANSKRNKKTIDSNYLAMTGYSRVRRSESSKKKSKKKRSYKV